MVEKRWSLFAITGMMLVAALFAILAVNVAWAYDGDTDTFARGYEMFQLTGVSDGDKESAALGNEAFDDLDGVGLMRAGSVLGLIAAAFLVVAFFAYEHQVITGRDWIGTVGISAGGLGALLWVIALILFPIGVGQLADTIGFADDLKWSAGLYFGILAALFSLGAVITAGVTTAISSGFRLEVAEGTADFD